jgi:hypothetical protein
VTIVEQIKEWALENYSVSYGASCLVECFDDSELDDMFPTLESAQEYASIMDERYKYTREDF